MDRTLKVRSVAIDGPSISLGDHEQLVDAHILTQDPSYGRVLFTAATAVVIVGRGVLVKDCHFEGPNEGTAILVIK
jgi:hypothetical protein